MTKVEIQPDTFRVRYCFRASKSIEIAETEHKFQICGREAVLTPKLPDIPIRDSDWLVINIRGIESEPKAREIAQKVKTACEISSVACRLGIDSGVDLPTSGFGQLVKDHVLQESGVLLRNNVHGIDVFQDDPRIRIGHFSATGVVRSLAEPFLSEVTNFSNAEYNLSQRTKDILLLLNYALTRKEAETQIIFAFSAVEMCGQDEDWSDEQKKLLKELADAATKTTFGTEKDRAEVSEAILRNTFKLSLRQGVLRLLRSLDLEHLRSTWDRLYKERSSLVHGLAPKPGSDYNDLASRAVSLCATILLKAVARDAPGADKHVDKFYVIP